MFREEIDMAGNAAKKKSSSCGSRQEHTSSQRCWRECLLDLAFFWHLQQVEC